jgi:hypothetical protein
MLLMNFQFVLKSPILLVIYFFNQLCADSALFVVVFPMCMTLLTQNFTTFSFTRPKIILLTYSKNLRNFSHTTLNRLKLPPYASSVSEFTISSHASMTVFTTSLGLISFPSLPLRPLTLQSVLHFSLTFLSM